MSKKSCFIIFVIALWFVIISYVAKIGLITKELDAVFGSMQNLYVAASAVVISLLVSKSKHYWLIMLGVAVIASVVIELVLGGAIISLALLYKIIAFVVYVYLVMLSRYML